MRFSSPPPVLYRITKSPLASRAGAAIRVKSR
jgi:hypothetical protein